MSEEPRSKDAEPTGDGGTHDRVPLRRANGIPIVGRSTITALVAVAEAVFSRDGRPPPADRLAWVDREMEDFLARAGARSRAVFGFTLWLTAILAPLFIGRFRLLHRLPLSERIEALRRLEERFSEPLLAVKAILCLVYYEHPDAARDVGFDGQCLVPRSATRGAS